MTIDSKNIRYRIILEELIMDWRAEEEIMSASYIVKATDDSGGLKEGKGGNVFTGKLF